LGELVFLNSVTNSMNFDIKLYKPSQDASQKTIFILAIIGVAPFTILAEILNVNHTIFSVIYRGLFLTLCLFLLFNTDLRKLFKKKYIQLFLLFFILYFIRVLSDTLFHPIKLGFPIIKYYTFTWGVIIIPVLAFNFKINTKQLEKAFKVILPIFLFICLYSLAISNFKFENGSERLWGGTTIHPIGLGHIAVTNIIISLFFFVKKHNNFGSKSFLAFNIIISLITLSLTESRGPIIALGIVLLGFLFFIVGIKNKKYLVFSTIALIFFTVILVVFTKFEDRVIFTIIHGGARIEHWKVAIHQFIESPILGSALEERVRHIYPHNIIIESFMALGILGGILFLVQLKNFLKISYKFLTSIHSNIKWVVLIFIQYFINSMFSGSLISNNLFWYLGVLLLSNREIYFTVNIDD